MKKHYIAVDFSKSYPGGKNIFYECQICGDAIMSYPTELVECSCGNIKIDAGYSRMMIENESKVKVFEEK